MPSAAPPPFDVVCVGLATLDTILPLPRWPDPDGRLVTDAPIEAGGGPAATAAVAVARLGGRVAFVGAVGDDPTGGRLLADLAESGVDVDAVKVVPGRTARSTILLDRSAGTRSILHAPGVALEALDVEARRRCETAAWIHVDHAGWPLIAGQDRARISVDAGNPIAGLDVQGVGLYAPTETALRARYPGRAPGEGVAAALSEGAQRVVVTAGSAGAIAADASGAWRVAAPSVEVVSTLGAGDVFHGALVEALAAGASLPEALRRANVAAGLSCRALDGRGAIPDAAELEAALPGAPALEPIVLAEAR